MKVTCKFIKKNDQKTGYELVTWYYDRNGEKKCKVEPCTDVTERQKRFIERDMFYEF